MKNKPLRCPDCGGTEVAVSCVELLMVNTDEHYCFSVKPYDPDSEAICLHCGWEGRRDQLVTEV